MSTPKSAQRVVSRTELLDHVEAAFGPVSVSKSELLAAAVASHARPEVIEVLETLPPRSFRSPRDLWTFLPNLPIES